MEEFISQLATTLTACAFLCFPCRSSFSSTLVGWKDCCQNLKRDADFWYKVWQEAGCPSSGVLFNIKNNTKRKYKSSVRRLKRRQHHLLRKKLAKSFAARKKIGFWSAVRRLNRPPSSRAPVVDNVSDPFEIANLFATNISNLLNTRSPTLRDTMHASIRSSLSACQLQDIAVSDDDIIQAIHLLKSGKSDSLGLSSEHLKYTCPAIVEDLSIFFTACLRHGFLPHSILDCVIVPVLKRGKNAS